MYPAITTLQTAKGLVIIRPAIAADALQFSELRQEALRENPSVFGSSYPARENCTTDWALKVLSRNPQDEFSFVVEVDQQLVGMTGVRRFPGIKLRHSATIGGVFIQPGWRGVGLSDQLIKHCIAWARLQQIAILKLAVVCGNQAALKVYQRNGFLIYGTEPKVILHDGVFFDEYLLYLDIQ
jgi:RimJ/RimL family protein N-acetyltransferase